MAQRGFLFVLLLLFTVVGCQKNNLDESLLQYKLAVKNYEKGQGVLYNTVNPYASVETTKKIQNFLSDMDQAFYKNKKLDSTEFIEIIDSILVKNGLKYDKALLSEREREILSILFSNLNCQNYLDLSTEFENIINNDDNLTAEQKMHLFKIIDFEKNFFYVILQKKKETFDDCKRRRLGDTFNNHYYLSQLIWISSWPISLAATAAECLYEINH